MRLFLLIPVLALTFCSTTAQAQRRTPVRRETPTVAASVPQRIDLPGISQGADNPFPELPVLDAINNKTTTLKSLAGEKGMALVFISNTCAEVQNQQKAIARFAQQAKAAGVNVVYVNSNQRVISELEGPPAMHEWGIKKGIKDPYIIDQRMQMAEVLGVQRLPEVFIFNPDGYLAYRGAVEATVGGKEAICFSCQALESITDMGRIKYSATAGEGCAIPPREE